VSGNLAVVGSRDEHFQSPDGIRYNAEVPPSNESIS
jgi:hypothetical protein